jgi:hypothetical protein
VRSSRSTLISYSRQPSLRGCIANQVQINDLTNGDEANGPLHRIALESFLIAGSQMSGQYFIDDSMHVLAKISHLELALGIALPVYLGVGVVLWCSMPVFRKVFRQYRYAGGIIAAALIWPFMLLQLAVIGMVFSIGWLSVNLARLFRRKE